MLWVLPGCRGIDIGSCWYLLEFLGVFIALLQTLHHLPTGDGWCLPGFAVECHPMVPCISSPLVLLGVLEGQPSVLLTVPSKLWGQLCPHLPSSLWVSGHWAAKFGAWLSAFRYAFSHSSLPLWKLLWLGNWTYISILTYISKPLWLTYASIFNLSWPEEILALFELSSAKWLGRSPGERNFRNLRSSHIFLIHLLPSSIVLLHYPWRWTFPLLPFWFANLSFIQGTRIELTWLFIQSWLSPSLLLCPWTQHPESQQKQCLSSPPQPEKKCHFSFISIVCCVSFLSAPSSKLPCPLSRQTSVDHTNRSRTWSPCALPSPPQWLLGPSSTAPLVLVSSACSPIGSGHAAPACGHAAPVYLLSNPIWGKILHIKASPSTFLF